jgi:hypothetical protein
MTGIRDMNAEEFKALVEVVRKASNEGELTLAAEVCQVGEDEFAALAVTAAPGAAADIIWICEGDKSYLFSERTMTRRYAEAAALGASRDPLRMIAATVRSESATYPRPTRLETFHDRPFCLSSEEITTAVARMRADAQYADIATARASNGAEFLFSSNHLSRDQAVSMAEWLAVGQCDNP